MPPKRGARRTAASTSSDRDSIIPGVSNNLDPKNPTLPNIPTKHSFAYGSQATAILPKQLVVQDNMDLSEMAETIERGRKQAEDREEAEAREAERERASRAGRRKASASPFNFFPQQSTREPTPDQVQLFGNLHEDMQSVVSGQSTATPSPPLPTIFSADSSPRSSNNKLYPSSLQQPPNGLGTPLGSSPQPTSVDNNSTAGSWSVERDVHDDDLKRTHPGRGSNITAPPRRISGLALIHDTIEEETEPNSQLSPEPQFEPEPEPEPAPVPQPELKLEPEPIPEPGPVVEPAPAPAVQQVPVQPPVNVHSASSLHSWASRAVVSRLVVILLTLLSCLTIYISMELLVEVSHSIDWPRLPRLFERPPHIPINASNPEEVNDLMNEVDRLRLQMSSLSKDVKGFKTEPANADHTPAPYPGHPIRSKRNYFSPALGAVVEPYITSPTAGKHRTWIHKTYLWLHSLVMHTDDHGPNKPATALVPWHDVGDCWCSIPRGGMWQLSVHLGKSHRIVPEEIAIEHVPDGASIMPGAAPRQIELWARFVGSVPDAPTAGRNSWFPRFFSSSSSSSPGSKNNNKNNPAEPEQIPASASVPAYVYSETGRFLLRKTILGVLQRRYPKEPESAYYSGDDDKHLPPDFYRIGRFEYDIHGRSNVQVFALDGAVHLPNVWVDKVVLRVRSNWGADVLCLYNVKLFGRE